MMLPKTRPPQHWERQISKYERKIAAAKTPTQRVYAQRMKHAAEQGLKASRLGIDTVETDTVVDLDPTEYREV
jgi:hypothetical protein